MVIIYKKTLEKKGVDDVASKRLDLSPFQAQTMSQGTTLFSCGLMETSRWPEVRRGCALQQQRPVGASLESLWDVLPCTEVHHHHHQSPANRAPWGPEATAAAMVPPGAITTLLQDLSLAEAAAAAASPSTAPPSKRQCRSLSCSDELGGGCRSSSAWRPQGSRVWTAVEKRRCHSGGSVQRGSGGGGPPPVGFPAMQRSSSFSLPARSNALELPCFGQRPSAACPTSASSSSAFTSLTASSMVSLLPSQPLSAATQPPQTLYLSHEQICLPSPASSPDSTPELERRGGHDGGLARSRSQPCVLNDKKIGMKRRRPADTHKQRPSLDLAKMTQKLRSFHSLSCPGITDREDVEGCQSSQATPTSFRSAASGGQCETSDFSSVSEQGGEHVAQPTSGGGTKEDDDDDEVTEVATDPTIEELDDWGSPVAVSSSNGKALWAGLCSTRKDMYQLGGELDIEQIERN